MSTSQDMASGVTAMAPSYQEPLDYISFFKNQTIFLTGATGGLGGCLLYKLAMELPTSKIFVLIRSESKADETWKKIMPDQIEAIYDSGKITLVTGDITKPNFGISANLLSKIVKQTTILIHSAANTSFSSTLLAAVKDNCLGALELARLASTFENLQHFVQLSTAYSNSHLPDGPIREEIYPLGDPESELKQILATGTSSYADKFPWPYSYAKHLMERLFFKKYPELPLLIVRPSCIGSSVSSPFPLYGPRSSTPIEQGFRLIGVNPGSGVIHAAEGRDSGANVFDEIPMDWVANLILLHTAVGTRGIVHAGAQSYIPRTFDDHLECFLGDSGAGGKEKILFTKDKKVKQCSWADFYKVWTRDWTFENGKSRMFTDVKGVLGVSVDGVDVEAYDRGRREKVRKDVMIYRAKSKSKI